MKTVLAICVISCLLTVGYAIDIGNFLSCGAHAASVGVCLTRFRSPLTGADSSFCTNCANSLIGYFQDCTGRDDVDSLMKGENQS